MTEQPRALMGAEEPDIDDELTSSADGAASFTVPAGMKKTRLDAFLGSVADLSRSRIKRLV